MKTISTAGLLTRNFHQTFSIFSIISLYAILINYIWCLSILATRTSLFSYSFSQSINDSTDSLTWLFLRFSKAASFTSFKIIPSQKASITRARICEYLLSQLNSAHISFSLVILTFSWLPHGCQIAYMISILITLTKWRVSSAQWRCSSLSCTD